MADAEATRQRIDVLLARHGSTGGNGSHGVVGALDRLCRAMAEDLVLVGAVVSLMPGVGAHTVSAASSSVARQVEETQFGLGEGPTRETFATRRPVLVPDLEVAGTSRWPGWAPTALAAGVGSAYAFPLHVGATIFGVLSAYRGPGPRLDADELHTALVFSEVATQVLLDGSLPGDGRVLGPDLDATLDTNAHVYQAQGMVMVELGVTLPEALARMRAHAWATDQDLATLAREILAGRAMPPQDGR